jgi:hypothetical protein
MFWKYGIKILFVFAIHHNLTAFASINEPETPSFHIKLITEPSEILDLKNLIQTHRIYIQRENMTDYSALDNKNDIEEQIGVISLLKRNGLGRIFGVYGFYYKLNQDSNDRLVGAIQMLGHPTIISGYAECVMTMHPEYCNQGLGYRFRKKFHEEIIEPILGHRIVFADPKAKDRHSLFVEHIFRGTLGYIHPDNLASRRLVKKLGHMPVRFGYKREIIYVYPPLLETEQFPARFSHNTIQLILQNDLSLNGEILRRYLSGE